MPDGPGSDSHDALLRRVAQAEARARDLSVLNDFAATLLHYQSDIDDVLWDVANQAVARMGLEDCVIYLLDEAGGVLVQRAAYGPKNPRGREILDPITIPLGKGVVGSAAASGRAERIADTRLDPRYICDDQMRLSELAVPMSFEGRVLGVIDSEHSQLDFFTEGHQEVFSALAAMAASRIAQARLDERIRALNRELEEKVTRRTAELAAAHARAEELLLNVLPAPIAARLKAGEERIAERYEDVAVLFADVVGFTPYSAAAEPERVVELLEAVFRTFDQLSAVAGAEKIKTVGDAYMVVVGVPERHADPLSQLARLALAMRDALPEIRRRLGQPLSVRFGLHAGPVVAGVIGSHRFAYDLWGDTVNLASRLEAHGEPDRIQIVASLAARLDERFLLSTARIVDLKGLGRVRTCFLLGER